LPEVRWFQENASGILLNRGNILSQNISHFINIINGFSTVNFTIRYKIHFIANLAKINILFLSVIRSLPVAKNKENAGEEQYC